MSWTPDRTARFVQSLAAVAFAVGLLGLVGHYAGIPLLVSVRPDFRAMSGLAAVCIMLLAVGVFAADLRWRHLAAATAATAMVLSAAVLLGYGQHGKDGFSPWWAEHVLLLPEEPGRMSGSTAVAIALIALGLLLRDRPRATDVSGAGGLILSGVALLGYAYGVDALYATALFNNMALHTALGLFLLSIAVLCIRPSVGWSSILNSPSEVGGATRRQLMFCLVLPLIGWIVAEALNARWLGVGAAMALFVAAAIVPLALLVLRDGSRLLALERTRRLHDDSLAAAADAAQAQLADQAARLQQEAAERAKVEEAIYRAQRLEAVGQLTGGIAHDFNNLLMVLSGNVQLLKRRLPADDSLRRYVDNLAVAVTKGSKVTQQLLAFSRSQRLDIRPTLIQSVVVTARQLIGSSLGPLIRVHIELDAHDAWALCDADQLELSLLNLAVNARDAMPAGGVLTIACSRAEMVQPDADAPDCILIRVLDTGIGMDADVVAHAAEPFFTTKDRGKGTGLGLAQVYGFVRQCQGEFRITSSPGQGTSVEMRFPSTPAPTHDSRHPDDERRDVSVTGTRASKQLRVMVIDDDDGVREVIVQALTEAGYDVVSASDGESGLAEMTRFEPAAAVIDFLMPGMHGADVARAAQARYPRLPIIFVSGYADTNALEGVSGASVLRKPFEMATLTRMVEQAVCE